MVEKVCRAEKCQKNVRKTAEKVVVRKMSENVRKNVGKNYSRQIPGYSRQKMT